MDILIVAMEASGDLHGAAVLEALRQALPTPLRPWGVGGPALRAAGLKAYAHAEEFSAMGIGDVLHHVPRLLRLRQHLLYLARKRHPPALALLCDAPDFNLALGHRLRLHRVPVAMLIAPQAWAWRPQRARTMRDEIDLLLTLFPFEPAFFRPYGIPTQYIGHPLAAAARSQSPQPAPHRRALVLLPGSRPAELQRHLPVMLQARARLEALAHTHTTVLAVAPTLAPDTIQKLLGPAHRDIELISGARAALDRAALAIVASGTASLEAAIAGVPSVVIYRTDPLTWAIARRLVRTPYIAMPNILHQGPLFPELLQQEVTPERIVQAAQRVIQRGPQLKEAMHRVVESLQPPHPWTDPSVCAAAQLIRHFALAEPISSM
ncbi:MAG: lipid-A-disaccharide synthase [Myxococcota bacterium]